MKLFTGPDAHDEALHMLTTLTAFGFADPLDLNQHRLAAPADVAVVRERLAAVPEEFRTDRGIHHSLSAYERLRDAAFTFYLRVR